VLRRRAVRIGAALVAAAGLIGALLAVEVVAALRRDYLPAASAPDLDGRYTPTGSRAGAGADAGSGGGPVTLLVLGDSTAAGVGVDAPGQSVSGQVAAGLARDGREVLVRSVAVSGARAGDLAEQIERARGLDDARRGNNGGREGARRGNNGGREGARRGNNGGREGARRTPTVALVLIGANDATHRTPLEEVQRDVRRAVAELRAAGAAVVVGTCPDLGAVRAFAQPLRALAAWQGRRVADVTERATRAAGGVPVDLAARTGPAFRADPRMLSSDEFHPSARGYRLWAQVLIPTIRSVLDGPASPALR